MAIKDIAIRITANIAGLSKGLQQAERQVAQTATRIEATGTRFTGAAGRLSLGLQRTSAGLSRMSEAALSFGMKMTLGVTVPMIAAGTAVWMAAQKFADTCEKLDNLSAATGLSVERIQELQFVSSQMGVSFDGVVTATVSLQRKLMGVEMDTGNAAEALRRLGVETDDGTGHLKSMDALFPEIIARLQGMSNASERNMLATQIFGRSLSDIAPILAMSSDQLAQLIKSAHDAGYIMSGETVAAGKELDAAFDDLNKAIGGATAELIRDLIPVIKKDLIPFIKKSVIPAIGTLGKKVGELATWFNGLSPGMKKTLGWAVLIVAAAGPLASLFSVLGGIINAVLVPAKWLAARAATAHARALDAESAALGRNTTAQGANAGAAGAGTGARAGGGTAGAAGGGAMAMAIPATLVIASAVIQIGQVSRLLAPGGEQMRKSNDWVGAIIEQFAQSPIMLPFTPFLEMDKAKRDKKYLDKQQAEVEKQSQEFGGPDVLLKEMVEYNKTHVQKYKIWTRGKKMKMEDWLPAFEDFSQYVAQKQAERDATAGAAAPAAAPGATVLGISSADQQRLDALASGRLQIENEAALRGIELDKERQRLQMMDAAGAMITDPNERVQAGYDRLRQKQQIAMLAEADRITGAADKKALEAASDADREAIKATAQLDIARLQSKHELALAQISIEEKAELDRVRKTEEAERASAERKTAFLADLGRKVLGRFLGAGRGMGAASLTSARGLDVSSFSQMELRSMLSDSAQIAAPSLPASLAQGVYRAPKLQDAYGMAITVNPSPLFSVEVERGTAAMLNNAAAVPTL